MGKKAVFGCMGVVGAVLFVLLLGLYLFVVRPVRSGLAALESVHRANERIENQDPYDSPPSGELEQEQVERFVSVQRQISERLEQELARLEEKYEEVSEQLEERDPSMREIMTVWGDIIKMYARAKDIQVEALNDQGFSLEEYHFVRRAFFQALGVGLLPYNLDSLAEAAASREVPTDMDAFEVRPDSPSTAVLERNRERVAEHADAADEWLVFAWWGL